MGSIVEKFYRHSPVAVQNLMMTAYGWHLHRLRFGGVHREFFQKIQKSQWLSPLEIRRIQDGEVQRLIRHAFENVPFYRERFQKLKLRTEDFKTVEDISKLPILKKEDLRLHGDEMLARGFRKSTLIRGTTSGTTGSAIEFFKSPETVQKIWAFLERFRNWAGVSCRHRRASFGVRMVVPAGKLRPPYSRYNLVERQRLFSIFAITPENVGEYYRELKRFRPAFLEGYPSAICLVARFMKEKNVRGIQPRGVITFAETLLESQRKLIEEQFECRVFDWYGTSEGQVFISQCEAGTYHISSEYCYLEVVDAVGNPLPPGQEGEIVGTSFVNNAQPLIRFETGDIGVASDGACTCGRGLPAFAKVIGRRDDFVVTPDGRILGRLDSVFKNTFHIRESQIIQETPDTLTILVVKDSEYGPADTQNLLKNLRYYVSNEMEFEIHFVDRIDRTGAGKCRAVISRIGYREGGSGSIAGLPKKRNESS